MKQKCKKNTQKGLKDRLTIVLESQNHRMSWVGKEPWGSSSLPPDSTQGNLEIKPYV